MSMGDTSSTMIPTVNVVTTSYHFQVPPGMTTYPFSQMLSDMSEDEERNALLAMKIRANAPGHATLVLGDQLNHLRNLMSQVEEDTALRCRFICGSTPQTQRKAIIEEVREGKADVLFATYSLAKEGLDIPRLDCLHLVTPKKERSVIQQAAGRIMRASPGKQTPIIFDYWDDLNQVCTKHLKARIKEVYVPLGMTVYGGPVAKRSPLSGLKF